MGRATGVQSQVESYQRLQKWYLISHCLTLSIIRYVSRVKRSNPEKGAALSPTLWCRSYWKGSFRVASRLQSPTLLIFLLFQRISRILVTKIEYPKVEIVVNTMSFMSLCYIVIIISITTIIIQIQAIRTRSFMICVSLILSPYTMREKQNIKAHANNTILTPPPRTAHLVVSKISIHLSWSRPKLICCYRIRKTQPRASTIERQLSVFSKSSNSLDHLVRVWCQPSTQFTPTAVQLYFFSGGLLW